MACTFRRSCVIFEGKLFNSILGLQAPMTARSVYWQDGMFMWPHHMQQEERLQSERLRSAHRWNVHHNWGLRLLDLDTDSFKSGRLVIRNLQARMRDGTLVDIPAEGRLPVLDLNEVMLGKEQVTIQLALPKLHLNRPNATLRGNNAAAAANAPVIDTRFIVEEFEVSDENTGEDLQSLAFRSLNVRLLPDSQDATGYDLLPIARFERSAVPGAPPQLDINYIPPILACDAWKPLNIDILQMLYHHLSSRMTSLANKVLTRGITFETHNAGDDVMMGRLAVLNEASTVLNALAFAEGIHPFTAYLELCRIVGQLAVFSAERRAPKLPAYDHDDLGNCFYHVKRQLDEYDVDIITYEERAFIGEGLRMQVAMESKWLEPAWQMFVGTQCSLPQAEIIRLMTKPGQLDMKIGSSDRVDQIFERGLKGLEFTHAPHPPRVLPSTPGLTFFQVNRDAQKSEWAQVQQSLTLAIRVNQSRFEVGPTGNIKGQRSLMLKQQGAYAATPIEFMLFLVPGDIKAPS
jgi:type VI secretion system protein ImpJ